MVDNRWSIAPPAAGRYFDTPDSAIAGLGRLTAREIGKFGSAPGLDAIFSSGHIAIYSTSQSAPGS